MPNEKEEQMMVRDLKQIFERMSAMKNEDLETPSDDDSLESMLWYEQYAIRAYEQLTFSSSTNAKAKQQIMINSLVDYTGTKRRAGALYTFKYEPESAEDLDYWDKYPLVMRMLDNSHATDSFLGINLHYLNPKYRRLLLVSLMTKLMGDTKDAESTIIGLNIKRLMVGANKYGRVCIRRYKYANMRGRALRIPTEHWTKVIYLPTYQFVGARPTKVWKDSYKKIKNLGLEGNNG